MIDLADESNIVNFQNIYDDTNYFIEAIVSDYDFYGDFIKAVKTCGSQLAIKRKHLKKNVESGWLDSIEECLSSLDAVIRRPTKEIVERDEVVPIEMSRNIGSRAIRHLAQHTDFINSFDGENILPSKILNTFRDESILTYENRFINTLVHRLYEFVNKRYSKLKKDGFNTTNISMEFDSDFTVGGSKGKMHIDMEVTDESAVNGGNENDKRFERVERLNAIVLQYMESDFVKSMEQNFVRPPIMRTNVITKNKDYRQCLILWEFIEVYDKIGYTVDVEETVEMPDDSYVDSLYSMLALEYLMFKFNFEYDFKNRSKVLAEQSSDAPLAPRFVTKFKDIDEKDYNVYDYEYRKVVPVSQVGSKRRLTAEEQKIKSAIDKALAADKASVDKKKAREEKDKRKSEND